MRRTLCKAALVGATIGVSVNLVGDYWPHEPADDFAGFVAMALSPFPLGLLLGWATKLPYWPLVGVLAPFTMYGLTMIELPFSWGIPEGNLFRLLTFAVPAMIGFLLTAWLCALESWAVGAAIAGTLVLACWAAPLVAGAISASERTRDFKNSGVPLVAPVIPNYRLASVDEWSLPEMVSLTYYPTAADNDGPAIAAYIRRATDATPKAACANPIPNSGWKTVTPCKEISPGVWRTRLENESTLLFARHGDALVQVAANDTPESALLAILPTFRPITAEELAALG
ncbi:hypothetical protein [Nonomuraea guangzhouensis]|uniref:Uncharacterized protein n=1 Tax=Nonomuraea guangzhouensis TaxID=1291555 RepID=A0ABW4GGW2_9ACTN|nr:hypothetical protein [Nonomuraea guangzhouensis]